MKPWTKALSLMAAIGLPGLPGTAIAAAAEIDRVPWSAFAETGTIEIVTRDADGVLRETPIWIVVVDGSGYVRTNDSRWLANIRRGSDVVIRAGDVELAVDAEERKDDSEYERVEEAFKAKYGWMQRVMSAFRFSRPTVLRLTPASPGTAATASTTR